MKQSNKLKLGFLIADEEDYNTIQGYFYDYGEATTDSKTI